MATLRPDGLEVQRCRSGQAAQVFFGKRTVLPGWQGMLTPAGQVSCPAASRSAVMPPVTLASGALAGVMPTAVTMPESRSVSTWRL
jgi:hypothetical protein